MRFSAIIKKQPRLIEAENYNQTTTLLLEGGHRVPRLLRCLFLRFHFFNLHFFFRLAFSHECWNYCLRLTKQLFYRYLIQIFVVYTHLLSEDCIPAAMRDTEKFFIHVTVYSRTQVYRYGPVRP